MKKEKENEKKLNKSTIQSEEGHDEPSALKSQDKAVAAVAEPFENSSTIEKSALQEEDIASTSEEQEAEPEPETDDEAPTASADKEPTRPVVHSAQSRIVEANTVDAVPVQIAVDKKPHAAQIVRADSVEAEEVPTVPIDSLQIINALEPEVAIHTVASMRGTNMQSPLVAQSAEYRRGLGEWIDIWRDGMRLKYVSLSLLPVIVGSTLAWMQAVVQQHHMVSPDVPHLISIIIAAILLQIGANLLNDYYDHQHGIDTSNTLGPGGLIQQGFAKPLNILIIGLTLLVLGTLIGLITAGTGGIFACLLVVLIALLAYFFSGSKWSLATLGLSELVGFLAFGPLPVISAYLIQTHGVYENRALVYSLPLGLLGAAVIYANNLRDYEGDQHAHKHTLATILKITPSRGIYTILLLAAYAVIIALGFPHGAPHFVLLTLWTFPTLVIAITGILRTKISAGFQDVMKQTLKIQGFFSIYLIIGLIATAILALLPPLPTIKLPFL
jgi:1,4-dihydroxy-2-naphthoate octaprenyltransferase